MLQKRASKETAALKRKSSTSYLNNSFYNYRLKSLTDGLTFEPTKIYNVSV